MAVNVCGMDSRLKTIKELLFDIPKSTTSGVYQIKIKYEEGDVIDKNLLPVSPLIANGKITITH